MHATIIAQSLSPTPAKSARSAVPRTRQGRTPSIAARKKAVLVGLGLSCLARGEWRMAMALTRLIRERELSHE